MRRSPLSWRLTTTPGPVQEQKSNRMLKNAGTPTPPELTRLGDSIRNRLIHYNELNQQLKNIGHRLLDTSCPQEMPNDKATPRVQGLIGDIIEIDAALAHQNADLEESIKKLVSLI